MPPPLPARPSPVPPLSLEDVELVDTPASPSMPDLLETASSSSTQTLVEQDDEGSDRSFEKISAVSGMRDELMQTVSVVEVDSNNDAEMGEHDAAEPNVNMTNLRTSQASPSHSELTTQEVEMVDAGDLETVDQKVLNALEHQKRSSGTDQQDVEEVMGSIINRLQAAIQPSSIDSKTGIQLEKIMETFFVTTVNYTKKFDEKDYQHEISFDRSITAFPAAEGPCSLYDALGRNFDQQILEESKLSRYTAIKTLPPVLHILIQRSQSMGSKNGNPVVIPETLYLDRYMDAPHDSPIFRRRVEDWMTKERIDDLKSQLAKVDANPQYVSFLENYRSKRHESTNTTPSNELEELPKTAVPQEENWDFDGPVDDDFLLVTQARDSSPSKEEHVSAVEDIRNTHTTLREMMENELKERQHTVQESLSSQKQTAYRLHAVICHRGHLTSGHYWVWIHDFENSVWRWYNDADVKENKNTEEVLQTLSTSGEPYFLCYVRDEDKDKYVSVPPRATPSNVDEPETISSQPLIADVDGDVRLDDDKPAV